MMNRLIEKIIVRLMDYENNHELQPNFIPAALELATGIIILYCIISE